MYIKNTGFTEKVCEFCGKKYLATNVHGTAKRQKFCSKRCREKSFARDNPNKTQEYRHRYYNKRLPKYCKICGTQILDRKSGRTICSTECRNRAQKENNRKFRKRVHSEFAEMKTEIGCQFCGYSKHGGSLDFHHFDGKDRRITGPMWMAGTELILGELERCILLCKNCHFELHGEME